MHSRRQGAYRLLAIAVVAAAAVSCAQHSNATSCEFDLLCPAGRICDAEHATCVLPAQRAVCERAGDGAACSYPGTPSGVCHSGTCFPAACGTGFRDSTEACDDGNLVSGDGCSADCLSDETCGNAIIDLASGESCDDGNLLSGDGCSPRCALELCGNEVTDPGESCDDGNLLSGDGCSADCLSDESCANSYTDYAAGEQCDDGNLRSRDGCSSGCTLETLSWVELPRPWKPTLLPWSAYDAARKRVVVFGGFNSDSWSELAWEFDGINWTGGGAAPFQAARNAMAMAYDSERERTVVFGTDDERWNTIIWEYDGTSWEEITTPDSGIPPFEPAFAYFPPLNAIVMFGGFGWNANTNETWLYDGSQWTDITTEIAPPPRWRPSMAYDEQRGRLVLFGGIGDEWLLADTWEFDGSTWTEVTPAQSPPARECPRLVYDSARERTVMFGGDFELGDTWEFDGSTWAEVTPALSPPARTDHTLAYDAHRQRTVLFGGRDDWNDALDDIWEYDGTAWTQVTVWPAPAANIQIAYVPARAVTVWYDQYSGRTWEHDGSRWWRVLTETSPPPGMQHVLANDPIRDRVVLHGRSLFAETWEYDGTNWQFVDTPTLPPPRTGAQLTYDPTRQRLVLNGGDGGATLLDDTWEYDGADWANASTVVRPAARAHHSLMFEPQLGQLLLTGGGTNRRPFVLLDSWLRVADTWHTTAELPSPHMLASLNWFPPLNSSLLVGGLTENSLVVSDVISFDRTQWAPIETVGAPLPARAAHAATYDAARRQLVIYGGVSESGMLRDDTWALRYQSEWPDEQCTNNIDDDGDQAVDCSDPDCEVHPICN